MGGVDLENVNPTIHNTLNQRAFLPSDYDDSVTDPLDAREIFDHIRSIKDPEHPLTLEQLNVVSESLITVDNEKDFIRVQFTPTIPHCSMASLIGLCIKVKLLWALPSRLKVEVCITPGTHSSENALNKQLADKERIVAALENPHLLNAVKKCLSGI